MCGEACSANLEASRNNLRVNEDPRQELTSNRGLCINASVRQPEKGRSLLLWQGPSILSWVVAIKVEVTSPLILASLSGFWKMGGGSPMPFGQGLVRAGCCQWGQGHHRLLLKPLRSFPSKVGEVAP